MAKSIPRTIKQLRIIRKGETNELSQVYEEFLEDGGQSALNMIDSLEQQLGKMDSILGEADPKLVSQFQKGVDRLTNSPLAQLVENYNSVIENGIRVATYKHCVKGFTRERAGQAARNVTVNFSKGGEQKVLMNSLYLFYNISIQGSFALMTAATRSKSSGYMDERRCCRVLADQTMLFLKRTRMVKKYTTRYPTMCWSITTCRLDLETGVTTIPLPYGLNFAVIWKQFSRRAGWYTNGEFTNSFFGQGGCG